MSLTTKETIILQLIRTDCVELNVNKIEFKLLKSFMGICIALKAFYFLIIRNKFHRSTCILIVKT